MRRLILVLLALVMSACSRPVPPTGPPPEPPPPTRADLIVYVLDETGQPLPGAVVTVAPIEGQPAVPVSSETPRTSDGSGFTHFDAYGSLRATARKDGYEEVTRDLAPGTHRLHLRRVRPPRRTGGVRLCGQAFCDDQGAFPALGASMFWLAWAERHDPAKADRNLDWLRQHHVDYVRALSMVGAQPYWQGREIDPNQPDHIDLLARATLRAYDTHGIRVQWTLFADAQVMRRHDREQYVRDVIARLNQIRPAVFAIEIANEHWQNGVDVEELRRLTRLADSLTDIPVAASAPVDTDCPHVTAVYGGGIADFGTPHFDRTYWEDGWRPVRQPWEWQFCAAAPKAYTQNEPIGPGSSVESERDAARIQAAYVVGLVAGAGGYVYHSDAGVRGDIELWEERGAVDALQWLSVARQNLPGDIPNWNRYNHHWPGHPFSGSLDHQIWPDGNRPTGVVRAFAAGDSRFIVPVIGIRGPVTLTARAAMRVEVRSPRTWVPLLTRDLAAGETLTLDGAEYLVVTGEYR